MADPEDLHARGPGGLGGSTLGFAHSAAAVGDRRRIVGRSVDLKQTVCSDGRRAVVRSVDLKQTMCIYCENPNLRHRSGWLVAERLYLRRKTNIPRVLLRK